MNELTDILQIVWLLIICGAAVAVGIGLLVGIPTFLIALSMRAAHAIKEKKEETSEYSEEDSRVASEIDSEYKKAVKEYNITESTMQNTILDEIAKSKGYAFKQGKLVKEALS